MINPDDNINEGMEPVKKLFEHKKVFKLDMQPIEKGIDPVSLFESR